MLSYRKLAMRVLGRPLHTGGNDSPRPASQRAAAFVLTAAMLITLTAPAFAKTWCIEDGNITVKAGTTGNNVTQNNVTTENDPDTIITNRDKNTASSHTVTIDAGNDKVEVTLKDVNIDTSSRNNAAVSVTGSGNTTIKLDGDNALKSDTYRSGIASTGSLTISGGENDSLTAQGGSGANGISSSGSLTISGGTVTATGGNSTGIVGYGGSGIYSSSGVAISGGAVTANGGDSKDGYGGNGIYSSSVAISGGTVKAAGGNGKDGYGGNGISSTSTTISGGTVTANGGSGNSSGGNGIRSNGVTISGGAVNATGGNSTGSDGSGGNGISSTSTTISGGTVTANGGNGGKNGSDSEGGNGIISFDHVAISGGTVNAAGGNGNGDNGVINNGIISSVIDLSGSLELTAKAGSPNGKALSRAGSELELDTIKDKLDPGAKVTATDANGETKQVSIPRPVEPEKPVIPEESSSSSGGGSAAPSAPASSLPGLVVTDKDGQRISYTSTQSGNTLTVCVGRFTASFRISLAALRQLRAEGIEAITFQTILCSTTLSLDELLTMGGEDAEAVLTHRFTDSSLTVG